MLRIQPNFRTFRGGQIVNRAKNKNNWDVTLNTSEVVYNLDIDARKLKKGAWLVFEENEASRYGKTPTWEVITGEFMKDWMKVIGG